MDDDAVRLGGIAVPLLPGVYVPAGVDQPMVRKNSRLAWWTIPAIVTASLTMMGGLGTLAISYARFATLPERVEAGEQIDKRQDQSIDKLTAIQETWQKIYERQEETENTQTWVEKDKQGTWCCTAETYEQCWEGSLWERCPSEETRRKK